MPARSLFTFPPSGRSIGPYREGVSQTSDAIRDRIGASLRHLLAGEREPRELSPEDGLFGPEVVWGPSTTRFDENLHKLTPRFADEGHYRIRLEMPPGRHHGHQ